MVSEKKFNIKRISVVIITIILVFCVVFFGATKIIYDSIFARYDMSVQVPTALSGLIQSRTVCQFPSGDNLLTGYLYHPASAQQSRGLIVFAPGFCAGGDDYLWQISALVEYGWCVFTFDNTGTIRSQGESQIGFSQAIPDLNAALKYVENNDRFGYNDLILMGHSRGGYAACCALSQNWDISAVVSVSGVNSAMDAIMQESANAVGYLAYGNYGFLWLYQAALFGTETLQMQASAVISQKEVPVLLIHGTQDKKTPLDAGAIVAYRQQITSAQVSYLFMDAGHTDIMYDTDGTANKALMENIHSFLLDSIAQ